MQSEKKQTSIENKNMEESKWAQNKVVPKLCNISGIPSPEAMD